MAPRRGAASARVDRVRGRVGIEVGCGCGRRGLLRGLRVGGMREGGGVGGVGRCGRVGGVGG